MNAIKAGDLVMVVRPYPCCGDRQAIGMMFTVREVSCEDTHCAACKHNFEREAVAWVNQKCGVNVSCLIRIDPPALPESVETEREVTA